MPLAGCSGDFSQRGLRAPQLAQFMELSQQSGLTSINTVLLRFNELGDDGARIVSCALIQNPSIQCLDLGFNNIGDMGAEELAKGLALSQNNGGLLTLHLSGNKITSKGFRALASALKSNSCLKSIHLTGNSGGATGTAHLAKALETNFSLTTLCLNGNKLGAVGATRLGSLLMKNHTLTHINLVSPTQHISICQS